MSETTVVEPEAGAGVAEPEMSTSRKLRDIVELMGRARERRDRLVIVRRNERASLRVIAEEAHLTHTAIADICRRANQSAGAAIVEPDGVAGVQE